MSQLPPALVEKGQMKETEFVSIAQGIKDENLAKADVAEMMVGFAEMVKSDEPSAPSDNDLSSVNDYVEGIWKFYRLMHYTGAALHNDTAMLIKMERRGSISIVNGKQILLTILAKPSTTDRLWTLGLLSFQEFFVTHAAMIVHGIAYDTDFDVAQKAIAEDRKDDTPGIGLRIVRSIKPVLEAEIGRLNAVISGRLNDLGTGPQPNAAPPNSDSAANQGGLEKVNTCLQDLEAMQQGVKKVAPIFTAGSFLMNAFVPVNLVLDKLKTIGFGLPWKGAVKIIPPIAMIDKSIASIQSGMERLAEPTQTLGKYLPPVIEGIKARESGIAETPGLSGQLFVTADLLPALRGDLTNLNDLIRGTRETAETVGNSMDRLSTVKGIGSLADSLKGGLFKLGSALQEAEGNNQDLIVVFERTLQWLPSYYAKIRKPVTGSKQCQITEGSIFKKQSCNQNITWFDDESEAVCDKCKKSVCGQHRVEVRPPANQPLRCSWLCVKCAGK